MKDEKYLADARKIGLDTNWLGSRESDRAGAPDRGDAAGGGRPAARAARASRRSEIGGRAMARKARAAPSASSGRPSAPAASRNCCAILPKGIKPHSAGARRSPRRARRVPGGDPGLRGEGRGVRKNGRRRDQPVRRAAVHGAGLRQGAGADPPMGGAIQHAHLHLRHQQYRRHARAQGEAASSA